METLAVFCSLHHCFPFSASLFVDAGDCGSQVRPLLACARSLHVGNACTLMQTGVGARMQMHTNALTHEKGIFLHFNHGICQSHHIPTTYIRHVSSACRIICMLCVQTLQPVHKSLCKNFTIKDVWNYILQAIIKQIRPNLHSAFAWLNWWSIACY